MFQILVNCQKTVADRIEFLNNLKVESSKLKAIKIRQILDIHSYYSNGVLFFQSVE